MSLILTGLEHDFDGDVYIGNFRFVPYRLGFKRMQYKYRVRIKTKGRG